MSHPYDQISFYKLEKISQGAELGIFGKKTPPSAILQLTVLTVRYQEVGTTKIFEGSVPAEKWIRAFAKS